MPKFRFEVEVDFEDVPEGYEPSEGLKIILKAHAMNLLMLETYNDRGDGKHYGYMNVHYTNKDRYEVSWGDTNSMSFNSTWYGKTVDEVGKNMDLEEYCEGMEDPDDVEA